MKNNILDRSIGEHHVTFFKSKSRARIAIARSKWNGHGGRPAPRYENSRPLLQSEHEQHGLVAHFAKFRRIYEGAFGRPAKPRQDCHILLTANLEGHGRGIDADTDIDLPKLLKADVVIGSERSIDQAREQEAAGRRQGCAAVWIRFAHLLLHLTGEWIDNDDVGFGALDILRHAARHRPGSASAHVWVERCFTAHRVRWNIEQ